MLLLAEAAATGEQDILARLREIILGYLDLVGDVINEIDGTRSADGKSGVDERAVLVFGIPASLAVFTRVGVDRDIGKRVQANLIPLVVGCLAAHSRTSDNDE